MDLKLERKVNAVRISWANPYANRYEVQYWVGNDALDFDEGPQGRWKTPSSAIVIDGRGGSATLKLGDAPISTRFVRVLMTESSNSCDLHGSSDVRNCVGYAIQSIEAGNMDVNGGFVDAAEDATGRNKPTYCSSSIDPWHSAADVNGGGHYEHTGFDLFFTSGLTNNLPAMIPVTLLYGTPDDAAAEIAYVEKRGYPVAYVEMGEEPDGKHAMPEDYAALYIQWARAIHKVDPNLRLGGPIFEGVNKDITVWPDARGRTSWMGRFVDYLRNHGRLKDLAFVSFEHYPFERCDITWKSLYEEPILMKHILDVWRADGVPKDVPLMVTESSLSAGLTGPMSQIFGALWLADSIGAFFEGGGKAYYHSPIQPQTVEPSCLGPASWSNFVADADFNIKGYTSYYWAAHMINLEWVAHHSGVHQMFPSSTGIKDSDNNILVTSYAVHRPDASWSLMLVNRDQNTAHLVRVAFADGASNRTMSFSGPVNVLSFGSEQYVWRGHGTSSYADPDGPPVGNSVSGGPETTYNLPKASITVLRGRIE